MGELGGTRTRPSVDGWWCWRDNGMLIWGRCPAARNCCLDRAIEGRDLFFLFFDLLGV